MNFPLFGSRPSPGADEGVSGKISYIIQNKLSEFACDHSRTALPLGTGRRLLFAQP